MVLAKILLTDCCLGVCLRGCFGSFMYFGSFMGWS